MFWVGFIVGVPIGAIICIGILYFLAIGKVSDEILESPF
jgi:hypothetical protein